VPATRTTSRGRYERACNPDDIDGRYERACNPDDVEGRYLAKAVLGQPRP
jgi:hypothetical protein